MVAFVEEVLEAVNEVLVEIEALRHPPGRQQHPHNEIEPGPTVKPTGK